MTLSSTRDDIRSEYPKVLAKMLANDASQKEIVGVTKAEIIKQLPKLSRRERREIARLIFDIEDDKKVLVDDDRRANERFLMLDDLEAKRGKTRRR